MTIEVLLNRETADAAAIRTELAAEFEALEKAGVRLTIKTVPAKPGSLNISDVVQFTLEHKEELAAALPFATAILQIVNTVLKRRPPTPTQKKPDKQSAKVKPAPAVVVNIGDRSLDFPAGDARVKRLISEVSSDEKPQLKPKPKAKGSTSKRTKLSTKKR